MGSWVKVRDGRWRYVSTTVVEEALGRGKCSRERFPPEERQKLFIQTGERFECYSDLKRWYRKTGHRSMERGEPGDVARRELEAWVASGSEGPPPATFHGWAPRKPVDIHKIYERMKNR